MSSNKINRINEDIQRVLSTLLRNIKDPRVNQGMISIAAAPASADQYGTGHAICAPSWSLSGWR